MAGLICAKCQRINPEEALFCQYCQAALSLPDNGGIPGDQPSISPPDQGEIVPAWLAAIRERKLREEGTNATQDDDTGSNLDAVLARLQGPRKNVPLPVMPSQEGQDSVPVTDLPAEESGVDTSAQAAAAEMQLTGGEPVGSPTVVQDRGTGGPQEETASGGEPEVQPQLFLLGEPAPAEPLAAYAPPPENSSDGDLELGLSQPEETSRPEQADPAPPPDPGPLVEPVGVPTPLVDPSSIPPGSDLEHRAAQTERPWIEIQGGLPGFEVDYGLTHPPFPAVTTEPQQAPGPSFEASLRAEREGFLLPAYKRTRASLIVRWLIALVMVTLTLLVIAGNRPATRLPQSIPVEVVAFDRSLNQLPVGANVLIVLDYEPGYAGEIENASGAVIRRLAGLGSNLLVITTSSHNAFLADKLLAAVASLSPAELAPYLSREKYVELGYLAGGQAGMRSLADDLKASIPISLSLEQSASAASLNGIHDLNDLDGILILTDSPDTARTWVEQIKPQLVGTKLWMAVSSQAVPLVRPYIRSGQVDGLIGGMYGAASYEEVTRQPGPAIQLWNGYYYALVIAFFIIITGGGLNYLGFVILGARHKEAKP